MVWRRGWDSNPRSSFPDTRFPSVLLKPLGHLSLRGNTISVAQTSGQKKIAPPFVFLEVISSLASLIFEICCRLEYATAEKLSGAELHALGIQNGHGPVRQHLQRQWLGDKLKSRTGQTTKATGPKSTHLVRQHGPAFYLVWVLSLHGRIIQNRKCVLTN